MPEQALEVARILDMAALGFTSVLVVALVPDVLMLRLRGGWRRLKSREPLKRIASQLETGNTRDSPSVDELKALKNPVCRFYEAALDRKGVYDSTIALERLLKEIDGGRTRLANVLKGVGPLAGMAGSVLGLMMYSTNLSNQEELVKALGFLLSTTLIGTYIAIGAWFVTFLMESEKERIQVDCVRAWETVQVYRNRSRLAAEARNREQEEMAEQLFFQEGQESRKQAKPSDTEVPEYSNQSVEPRPEPEGTNLPTQPIEKGRQNQKHVINRSSTRPDDGKRLRVF
jgi:hypothetical protein